MDETRKAQYWLALIVAVVLTALYVERRALYDRYADHEAGLAQLEAAQVQCESLEREIAETEQRVEYLRTDPLEIEASVRRSKGLVREGETIYRIQPLPAATGQ